MPVIPNTRFTLQVDVTVTVSRTGLPSSKPREAAADRRLRAGKVSAHWFLGPASTVEPRLTHPGDAGGAGGQGCNGADGPEHTRR